MGIIVHLNDTFGPDQLKDLTAADITLLLISLAFSIIAARLSWSCSNKYNTFFRVLFASLAFFFGETYIILFFVFRADICKNFLG
jgi:hypothetical protein